MIFLVFMLINSYLISKHLLFFLTKIKLKKNENQHCTKLESENVTVDATHGATTILSFQGTCGNVTSILLLILLGMMAG